MGDHDDENKVLTILNSAVENTNEAFVTIDENHKVIFFNKAAEEIFGYARHEVMGHDLDIIMSPDCSRDHRRAVDSYVRTKIPRSIGHERELVASRKNGETFPAEISFSVSKVNDKLYFTGIVRDLTETKALQEQIARSERLASLGQVVAEITHEIKNPLMMIGGFARQLISVIGDEKSLTKLDIIVEEVSRLEGLLNELREFYMPRALTLEEIDINGLAREVYLLVKGDCESKNIQTEFKADKKSVVIEGDRGKLKQVFLNLVKNSIEAMEKGGNLSLQSQLSGDLVGITVTDDGPGIPETDLEKVFSPFFTTKRHGTGLGLSISKSIIEDHKGSSFTLKSQKGKETVFKITMPIRRPAVKASNEEKERRKT
jgi:PAS domain S-box-containing protein